MIGNTEQKTLNPLLECLYIVVKRHNSAFKKEVFLNDPEFQSEKLSHTQFIRAAARANLYAKLNTASIAKLYSIDLPVILLLKDGKVCILEKIEGNTAFITRPDFPEKQEKMNMSELKEIYSSHYFQLTPMFGHRTKEGIKKKGWLWYVVLKQMPTYSEVIVASFFINLFTLAIPLFIMNVYDKVIPNKAIETLWTLSLAVLVVLIFDFIIRELRTYFIDRSSRNVDTWLSAVLFEQLLDIKLSERPRSIGTLINSVQSFESIKDFLSSTTIVALVDFPFIFIFLIIIFALGGWLVVIPILVIPIVLLISYVNQHHTTSTVEKIVAMNSRKQSILIETLQNIQAVKLTMSEEVMQHRWEDLIEKLSRSVAKNRFHTNFSTNLSLFSQYVASIAIIIGGVYRVSDGAMQLGALIAVSILTGRCLAPVIQLTSIFSRYKQARSSLDLINKILALPVERPPEKTFLSLPMLKGDFEFREVSFTYPSQNKPQLEKVNFKINSREHVGIIGLNGSGKSTILKLMLKLYEPTEGTLLIDGIESNQLDPSELRRFIGYVPQEIGLFQGSIKDNLKMGIIGVDDDRLLRAAELSGLSRFIKEDPEGFNRLVGELGQALSGGERQVIGLTRALLLNPSVLILDEPTNSMDDLAIAKFVEVVKQLMQEKTIILVTHKLNLLNLVNRVLVVHNGKIVADGPRDIILKRIQEQRKAPVKSNR